MTELECIRVVVCDDHDLFRRGVAEMLSYAGDVEVVGEVADHDEAVEVVFEERPDVVLLDLEMPGMGADASMGRMLSLSPPPKVVVFSMHDEPGMVRHFLERGAVAYFPKSAGMGELVEAALRAVAETSVPDGVAVEISVTGDEARLPRPAAVQAYLIMREAMRNAVRHSGCSRIATRMEVGEAEVVGSVEDDGQGFDPEAVAKASPSWGVGLRSRERAEMLGGELRLALKLGEGTRVELGVPLEVRP